MIVVYLLGLAWIALVFGICIGDFFDVQFESLGVGYEAIKNLRTKEKPKAMKIAA